MLLLFLALFRSWEELAQLLDENKIHYMCSFGPLEVHWSSAWDHGYLGRKQSDRVFWISYFGYIIGRFIEEEEFCFLASAFFKSQVKEWEEQGRTMWARPQTQKSCVCVHFLVGYRNPLRNAGREKCVLSASLPQESQESHLDHQDQDHQESHLTALASTKMGLQIFSGHSGGIAREK